MAEICMQVVVSGRVQGVWFRRFTQEHALAGGVTGWVRNLADGRVEAMLCGDERAVRHVETWLSRGPDMARVDRMDTQEVSLRAFEGFEIREDEGH
ncbi:putative Acylphosphate phosphohydrolase [Marinobacterium lacunae]|uniref:Acylphosphatase n=1 Tax=Marinobacterium lacunae TaxID=1232683 RepID=A0A081FU75_9GAMM|nr:acylphosphatase [Marinobacterium lacunae]KEA62080.1 putative Acylphosphate phosphohydrolase [Marinobacterium lacunae]